MLSTRDVQFRCPFHACCMCSMHGMGCSGDAHHSGDPMFTWQATACSHPHEYVVSCLTFLLEPLTSHPVVAVRRDLSALELHAMDHGLPIKHMIPAQPQRHSSQPPGHSSSALRLTSTLRGLARNGCDSTPELKLVLNQPYSRIHSQL